MKVYNEIPSEELLRNFDILKKYLQGNEPFLFNVISQVYSELDMAFEPPVHEKDYKIKFVEIEGRFQQFGRRLSRGSHVCFRLVEKICDCLDNGQLPGVVKDPLIRDIAFRLPKHDATFSLTPQYRWIISWKIPEMSFNIIAYGPDNTEVIPDYVIQLVQSSIEALKASSYLVTSILITIAIEATLRDILISHGYSYQKHGRPFDIYHPTQASVRSNGDHYSLRFIDEPVHSLDKFRNNQNGNEEIEIRIRREIKGRQGNERIDLTILNPSELVDYWSMDQIEQHREDNIGGLGEALSLARRERIIDERDLHTDIDKIIQAIRNHSIHLSEESLREELPHHNTLDEFLNSREMVLDLLYYSLPFISSQYLQLNGLSLTDST